MIRLYKATGEAKYREGAYIPMAAILRHTWLFNPGYREYSGRNIFMLTEGMPTVYANGWEEAVMLRYMNLLLLEGKDVLTKPITNMTMQLLRWKCVSMADGMVPLLPDSTIIYKGIPREWSLPVDPASYIPVEGFGYLEWDFSGQHDKLGRVSQGPYCFGMLPEAAMLLFHPIGKQVQFYCEVPVAINKKDANTVSFSTITGDGTYQCRILKKTGITVMVTPREAGGPVKLVDDKNSGWLNFSAKAGTAYTIQVTNH
ncbi:MAG: hypothetical protein EOP51_26805 [Sphingobacteriales bacterium]|nr:MAG: hypothetical protein EOP51_26805 [Sphingobacteriales bacterium]